MTLRRRLAWTAAAAAAAATTVVVVQWRCSTAARIAAREAVYHSLGIFEPGSAEFVPLPPETPHRTDAAALGNALFNDSRLAGPQRTCGTCHPTFAGGADDKVHDGLLTRSTHNAVFASCHLHDGRLRSLEGLVEFMITNSTMCGSSASAIAERLGRDAKMAERFRSIYETGVAPSNVVDALAQRLRARVAASGPFDRYLAGRKDALNEAQARGFEVFKSASCIKCHHGPALGGRAVRDGRKVPALRGISRRRRFLADGSAAELQAAVASMKAAQGLSTADTAALLEFLQKL